MQGRTDRLLRALKVQSTMQEALEVNDKGDPCSYDDRQCHNVAGSSAS